MTTPAQTMLELADELGSVPLLHHWDEKLHDLHERIEAVLRSAASPVDGRGALIEKALRRAEPVVLDRACGGRMITSKEEAESIHEEILAALAQPAGDGK